MCFLMMLQSKASFVIVFALFHQAVYRIGANDPIQKRRVLASMLNDYDKHIRPESNSSHNYDSPVHVGINMFLRSIDEISDSEKTFKMQMTFRQLWNDQRLSFTPFGSSTTITSSDLTPFWTPDMFFATEVNSRLHDLITPNIFLRIWPNGDVLTSIRVTAQVKCPMEFKYFPFDEQTCSLRIGSYGHTVDDLVLDWMTDGVYVLKPIPMPSNFEFTGYKMGNCTSKTTTGEYGCLKLSVSFKRLFNYYAVTIYIPFAMLVIAAYLSLWINENNTARLLYGIIIIFCMCASLVEVSKTFPKVSYTKAVDVWTGTCLTFVFWGALVEFVLVYYLSQRAGKAKSSQQTDDHNDTDAGMPMKQLPIQTDEETGKRDVPPSAATANTWWSRLGYSRLTLAQKIDFITRIAYPIFFVFFNIIYWSSCSA